MGWIGGLHILIEGIQPFSPGQEPFDRVSPEPEEQSCRARGDLRSLTRSETWLVGRTDETNDARYAFPTSRSSEFTALRTISRRKEKKHVNPHSAGDVRSSVPQTVRQRWTRRAGTVAVSVSAAPAAIILVLAGLNILPAGTNVVTLVAASIFPYIGPTLVAIALAAAALTVPIAFRPARRWPTRLTALTAVAALLSSSAITASISFAAVAAGGSVDIVRALGISTAPVAPNQTETYLTIDGQPLNALVYEPAGTLVGAPVMTYIHGGGWVSGDAEDAGSTARWYADRGWLVVSVDYRLASSEHPAWDEAPADVACALTWTATLARSLGAQADRVVLAGDSAGGNLALDVGWTAATGAQSSSCPEAGAVPVPAAVVVGYPVGNPRYTYDHGATWFFDQDPRDFTEDYLGGSPKEHTDRLAAVSPGVQLSPRTPPTPIVQPERDDFIPAEGNRILAEQGRAAGADVTIATIPFSHHAFDVLTDSLGGQAKLSIATAWLAGEGLRTPK